MKYADYASLYVGTKQGSTKHKLIVNRYNQIKPLPRGYKVTYTDSWCATFVSFVLVSCGCKKDVFECSANRMREKFKKKKLLLSKDDTPKKNDVIFYDWNNDKWSDHVGIISKVTKTSYIVIEGNKDKKVGVRTILKKSKSVQAIGRI